MEPCLMEVTQHRAKVERRKKPKTPRGMAVGLLLDTTFLKHCTCSICVSSYFTLTCAHSIQASPPLWTIRALLISNSLMLSWNATQSAPHSLSPAIIFTRAWLLQQMPRRNVHSRSGHRRHRLLLHVARRLSLLTSRRPLLPQPVFQEGFDALLSGFFYGRLVRTHSLFPVRMANGLCGKPALLKSSFENEGPRLETESTSGILL